MSNSIYKYVYICMCAGEQAYKQEWENRICKKKSRLNLYCTVIVLETMVWEWEIEAFYCFHCCCCCCCFFLWYFLPFSQSELRKKGNSSVNMAGQYTNKYVYVGVFPKKKSFINTMATATHCNRMHTTTLMRWNFNVLYANNIKIIR